MANTTTGGTAENYMERLTGTWRNRIAILFVEPWRQRELRNPTTHYPGILEQ